MVHQYLKTCVLSVCVAALCGGRAFGGFFWCDVCEKAIWDEDWGSHNVKSEHGNKMPKTFFCDGCYVKWHGVRKNVLYHYRNEQTCRVVDEDGISQAYKVPPFEEHVEKVHCVLEYAFWCSKCEKQIGVNSWITHLYFECKCYDEIYSYPATETFCCSLCKEDGKELPVFPLMLKYEHLRDKHCDYLPKREFFCKSCKGRILEANWQEHKEKQHKIDIFQCYICQEVRKECYEAHMATCHPGQCSLPFCRKTFSEEKRGEHMRKEHGFPCPICGEQIDTLLEVHAGRKHPFFEGRCKFQRLGQNGNKYESCKWPCFTAPGWMYIRHHLRKNVHMVGENGENKKTFFVWCPRRDFFGQHDKVKEHVKSKHKDCSFDCQECNNVDVWRNEKQHRQVEHDKSHWWCMDCANVIQYKSKDEKERSESRNKHLLTMHKGYGECPVCGDVVRMETIGSHAREKRHKNLYFWCFLCGGLQKGDQSDHMRYTHCFCGICGTWVSNSVVRHDKKHKDCYFCLLCPGIFKDEAEHDTKNNHKDVKLCVCGRYVPLFQVYDWWHVENHSVHCPLCKKVHPLNQMMTEHECKWGVCKPIANTKELTWKWQCDPSCKNFIKPCPLERKGCKFTGSAEQLTVHMREEHKCEETCGFNESEDFVHGASCRNGPANCPICKREVPDRKQHWMKEHKCVEECPVASGSRTSGHNFCCEQWVGQCPMCGEGYMDHEHRRKEHGCTEECVLSQVTNKDGIYISVEHHGHKDGKDGKVGKWVVFY